MSEREIDDKTAAELMGTLAVNPIGAVRGSVEAAIGIAAPAQRKLGRIADGEVEATDDDLREVLRDLNVARQMITLAADSLRVHLEGKRPNAKGGEA